MPWYSRWRNVFRSERLDEELESELQYHLAETVDRLVESGISRPDALREANSRFGNYSIQKEKTRDMNIAAWLDSTRADVIYALRQLRLNPGFASIAILSLALGIGANTAIFQLIDAIRLKTLPVRNPQELVSIDFEQKSLFRSGWSSSRSANMTFGQWEQVRERQQAFNGVLAWSAARFNLADGGKPHYAEGLYVSGDFFRVLGVTPALGRTFTAEDDGATCNASAVLSYPFWQREYGGSTAILGQPIRLNGHAFPVVAVTPPAFFGVEVGAGYDVAIPLCADSLLVGEGRGRIALRSAWWLSMMGRLKPGWTMARATANLHALSPGVMRATLPADYKPDMAKLYLRNQLAVTEGGTGVSRLRREYERPLWLLLATAGLVLLIACANLANLLLARATARETEIAVRLAIGASRPRLVRQLLAESLLLAATGAALGAGLAVALSRTMVAFIRTPGNPTFIDLAMDWRVLAFTAALGVLTCVLFGLLPALRATYLFPASAMRSGGRSVTAGRERFSVRRALVAGQVALSLVLLFGALLFARSLHNLLTLDAGFRPDGVLTASIDFTKAQYPKERRLGVYREIAQRISALPGVSSAAQVGWTPVSGASWDDEVGPDGSTAAASGNNAYFNTAGPGYFRTMGTRLLAGRDFSDRDTPESPQVAIVNEMFARRFFGGANPVGRTFHMGVAAGESEPLIRVVGMVENTKYGELREEFKPIVFLSAWQGRDPGTSARFVMRVVDGTPASVAAAAQKTMQDMSPSISIECLPFSRQLDDSLLREKLMAALSVAFGFLAALLATLGLYGVMAYTVARRHSEIGVRVALGANRSRVVRLILGEAIVLVGLGVAGGIVLSLWASSAASALLYEMEPRDPASLLGSAALLVVVALAAAYIPARRAAALDPLAALRSE